VSYSGPGTTDTSDAAVAPVDRDLGGCPVIHADFSESKEVGTYWRWADELRESSPAFFNTYGPGYWVFTRHDEVRDIYRNPDLFSSESITPWEPDPLYRFVPTQIDRPDHVKYRRILNPWFGPDAVEKMTPRAREICGRLVAEVAPQGSCDFTHEFALRYPTEVFLEMIGVPYQEADKFVPWVEDFFGGFSGDPAGQQAMVDALSGIKDYWRRALDERRGEPEPREGDLASYLMHAEFDGKSLDEAIVLDMLQVLVLAGLDTTRATLGYIFWDLGKHPERRRRLIDDPSLIPDAVEEYLRFYTIIFGDGRKVTRDEEFYGVQLKKGDMVYALVSGANRDPREYEQADEVVLDRSGNHHFGFAGGPHRCLGIHLARRELQLGVEEWLRVIPDFRIAVDEHTLSERGGGAMMTLLGLPLEWEPKS
jgi:cytochrome P450